MKADKRVTALFIIVAFILLLHSQIFSVWLPTGGSFIYTQMSINDARTGAILEWSGSVYDVDTGSTQGYATVTFDIIPNVPGDVNIKSIKENWYKVYGYAVVNGVNVPVYIQSGETVLADGTNYECRALITHELFDTWGNFEMTYFYLEISDDGTSKYGTGGGTTTTTTTTSTTSTTIPPWETTTTTSTTTTTTIPVTTTTQYWWQTTTTTIPSTTQQTTTTAYISTTTTTQYGETTTTSTTYPWWYFWETDETTTTSISGATTSQPSTTQKTIAQPETQNSTIAIILLGILAVGLVAFTRRGN